MKYIFITFARLRILRGGFNKTQGHFVTIQKFNFAPSMKNGTALEISIIDQALELSQILRVAGVEKLWTCKIVCTVFRSIGKANTDFNWKIKYGF